MKENNKTETAENIIKELAEDNNLCYVCNDDPGFRRVKRGRGFIYLNGDETIINDEKLLNRFHSLVIPPAWENVWICKKSSGHIQVTGRDAKGRKQYIYHPKWSEISSGTKFSRLYEFGKKLTDLRNKIEEDLKKKIMTKDKVLAIVVKLLDATLIRIGNNVYAETNDSYGLTTLKNKHVRVNGSGVRIKFKAKSNKIWDMDIKDKRLVKLIKKCQELPGQELFTYINYDGEINSVTSNEVNEYLKETMGENYTAKDFRTWGGTALSAVELYNAGLFDSASEAEKKIKQAVKNVAGYLSNTASVCRKYYIHPDILESYRDGSLFNIMQGIFMQKNSPPYYNEAELAVLQVLESKNNEKNEL